MRIVEPGSFVMLTDMRRAWAFFTFVLFCAPSHASATAPDPYLSVQWGLRAIHAEAAWRASKGSGAIVAVIDTGVDGAHPDLKGRVLAGKDLVDDDDDASDENGHGTLIAGIIAARSLNGIGVASVAPSARILPVRVLDANGTGSSADVVDGIGWALDHGADVINLSLAQDPGGLLGGDLLRDPSVDRAIRQAAGRGATVVVASGNDHDGGRSETAYDATTPGVIVVGASTKGGSRAAYSNFGSGLDIVAPGGGSATDPSSETGCNDHNAIVSTWWDPATKDHGYGAGCGTSMAVAFASGVAAQLHSRGSTNAEAVRRLISTAVDLGAKGWDDRTGAGRIDAARALGVKPPRKVERPSPRTQIAAARRDVHSSGSLARPASASAARVTTGRPVRTDALAAQVPTSPRTPEGERMRLGAALLLCAVLFGHGWRMIWSHPRGPFSSG